MRTLHVKSLSQYLYTPCKYPYYNQRLWDSCACACLFLYLFVQLLETGIRFVCQSVEKSQSLRQADLQVFLFTPSTSVCLLFFIFKLIFCILLLLFCLFVCLVFFSLVSCYCSSHCCFILKRIQLNKTNKTKNQQNNNNKKKKQHTHTRKQPKPDIHNSTKSTFQEGTVPTPTTAITMSSVVNTSPVDNSPENSNTGVSAIEHYAETKLDCSDRDCEKEMAEDTGEHHAVEIEQVKTKKLIYKLSETPPLRLLLFSSLQVCCVTLLSCFVYTASLSSENFTRKVTKSCSALAP